MVDVWSSKSVSLPRQMTHLNEVPLPIDESVFLHAQPSDLYIAALNSPDRSTSLVAQMIRVNRILMEVNDVIAEAAACDDDTLMVVEHKITSLSYKLNDWHCSLPDCMRDTPENLQRYAEQGLGRIFVAVYLGYYHYGQVLLYQFLHQDRVQTGESERANKCKEFAAKLCDLVYRAHATPGCEVLYNSTLSTITTRTCSLTNLPKSGRPHPGYSIHDTDSHSPLQYLGSRNRISTRTSRTKLLYSFTSEGVLAHARILLRTPADLS